MMTQEKFLESLAKAKNVICVTDAEVSTDSVAAALVVNGYLQSQKKKTSVFIPQKILEKQSKIFASYDFLTEDPSQNQEKYDLVLYFGALRLEFPPSVQVIDLSTLATSSKNLSWCEIVFEFLQFLKYPLEEKDATLLLSGIITNTDSFLNPSTTKESLKFASELQNLGADQSLVIDYFFKQKSLTTIKLWGKIFNQMQFDPQHEIVWSVINKNDLDLLEAKTQDIDNIGDSILPFIQESLVSVLFVQEGDQVLVQIRSQQEQDWKTLFEQFDCTLKPYGVDIVIQDLWLAQVEVMILEVLMYQIPRNQNLTIPGNIPFSVVKIKKKSQETPPFPVPQWVKKLE